jgi:hypothetical protein
MATTNTKRAAISADIFMPKLTLTLNFADGKELVIDANSLRPEIRNMAMMHGLKQKLVDAAALSRNPANGQPASISDKYDAVKRVADRLMSEDGNWNEGRGEGGTSAPNSNILLRALMRMTGRDEAFTRDFMSSKTKEQIAALRKNPKVMAAIAEIQAATVVNGVNTDALLGELGLDDDGNEPAATSPSSEKPARPTARSRKPKLATAPVEE